MFWKQRIYLDAAAGREASASSTHKEGRAMKKRLEDAREKVARAVECKADNVVFTSGATEANAIAILGIAASRQTTGDRRPHMLYLPSAHASIVENMKIAAGALPAGRQGFGVEIEPLKIKNGEVDIEALKAQLRPETVLVSMEAVCGETGAIWNTREVSNAIRSTGTPPTRGARAARPILPLAGGVPASLSSALLHVDASQAVFTEKLTRSHYGADILVFDGNKIGARGAGCLIAHRAIPLAPLYGGGGQERGLRSGTENVEAIEKFAKELECALGKREEFKARSTTLRAQLRAALSGIPNLYINEGRTNAPHILNISLPGRDADYLVALLDEAGFALSTKSACESMSGEGSRAVLALTGDFARAASTLRVSFDATISPRDLVRFARALRSTAAFIDSTALGEHH